MPFIGIVTEKNSEKELKNCLIKTNQVVIINEKTLDNVKNVKFETLIINNANEEIMNDNMKRILENAKVLLVNSDNVSDLSLINNLKLFVITYGFSNKATVTASSVNEDEVLVCIQRNIKDIDNNIIEPQEIKCMANSNPYITMIVAIINLIYKK